MLHMGPSRQQTLHEEAIAVHTSPPLVTHVRAYLAVVNKEPQIGRKTPQLSLMTLTQVEEPPTDWSQTFWTLGIMHCGNSRRISARRLPYGPKCTPRSTAGPLGKPRGDGPLNVSDQEITFLRGGGWGPQEPLPKPPAST